MASNGATTLELNVSLLVELDSDARLELVEELQKEWKNLLHEASMRILKLDTRDDGLKRISSRVTMTPSLVDLNRQREMSAANSDLAPVLELVKDTSESSPVADLQAS